MAANNFQSGGVDNNWSTPSNWSLGSVPTASDGNVATFLVGSPDCTVDISAVCNSIDFTNYINTITMTNGISSSGSVTLGSGMTIAGSGNLTINNISTITSNGKTWPNSLTITSSATSITITGAFIVSGSLTFSVTGFVTLNGSSVSVGANISNVGTNTITGNGTIILIGSGTCSGNFACNFTFNTSGTITMGATFGYGINTLTHTLGTVITTGNLFTIIGGSATLAVNGITWNNVQFGNTTATYTLTQNFNASGTVTLGSTTVVTTINGLFNINCSGSLTTAGTTGYITGTATIVMNGTGTIQTVSSTYIRNNLTFNTAGTITIGTLLYYQTGILTYTAGSIITSGSLLYILGSTTLNTSGMNGVSTNRWNNVNFGSGGVPSITFSSNFYLSGTLGVGNGSTSVSLNGAFNIYCSGSISSTVAASGTLSSFIMDGTGSLVWTNSACIINFTFNSPSGTITFPSNVQMSRIVTYSAGTMITSASTLSNNFASGLQLNTAGMTWGNVTFNGTTINTLLSNLNMTGNLTLGTTTLNTAINGAYNINCSGNVTYLNTTGNTTGTATIVMNGTNKTLSTAALTTGILSNPITFSGSGLSLIGNLNYQTGPIAVSGGTVTSSINTLNLVGATTASTNTLTWNNVNIYNNGTLTLGNDFQMGGILSTNGTTTINGNTLEGSSWSANTTTLSGSSNVSFTNSTIQGTAITINKSNTLTLVGNLVWNPTTFTYSAGTISTAGSTLVINGNRTFNGPVTWNNWNVSGNPLLTFNSFQTFNGTMNIGSNCSFTGNSAEFTTNTLLASVANTTITLASTKTYTVTNNFSVQGFSGFPVLFKASSGGSQAILTVNVGASEGVNYGNATDIDSSLGITVFSTLGSFFNTLNWTSINLPSASSTFVN